VRVVVDGLWKDAAGNVAGISGLATNESDKDLSICNVSLDILDDGGAKVSTAIASTIGLKAGQNWRFQAVFANPFSVSFKSVAPGTVLAVSEPTSRNLRLGIFGSALSLPLSQSLGLESASGVFVAGVAPGSPAARAGIVQGDVILKYGPKKVHANADLQSDLAATAPGTKVQILIWRARKEVTVQLVL